jgi:hypothetical protein
LNKLAFFTVIFFYSISGFSQTNSDYSVIFGKHYKEAETFIRDNPNLPDTLKKYDFDTRFSISLIFPELIRYSNLKDVIETSNLKVLYIQFGNEYSDFSIGRFQMKPSFIEALEKDYNRMYFKGEKLFGLPWFDINNTSECRSERVKRMSDEKWQMKYLMLFIAVTNQNFHYIVWNDDIERLKFYSSAYNSGYSNSEEEIRTKIGRKFYKIGLFDSESYSYSDISVYYFINAK